MWKENYALMRPSPIKKPQCLRNMEKLAQEASGLSAVLQTLANPLTEKKQNQYFENNSST